MHRTKMRRRESALWRRSPKGCCCWLWLSRTVWDDARSSHHNKITTIIAILCCCSYWEGTQGKIWQWWWWCSSLPSTNTSLDELHLSCVFAWEQSKGRVYEHWFASTLRRPRTGDWTAATDRPQPRAAQCQLEGAAGGPRTRSANVWQRRIDWQNKR